MSDNSSEITSQKNRLHTLAKDKGEHTNGSDEEEDDVDNLLTLSANGKRKTIKSRHAKDGDFYEGSDEDEDSDYQVSHSQKSKEEVEPVKPELKKVKKRKFRRIKFEKKEAVEKKSIFNKAHLE